MVEQLRERQVGGVETGASHGGSSFSCINCHTLHGEGAYFTPEAGNVMTRWGVLGDPKVAYEMLDG